MPSFLPRGAHGGVGAGQMSRVDSVKIAVMKAHSRWQAAWSASDAFFPFPDGVEEALARATAVIQPGGSVRDADVIAAANVEYGDGLYRRAPFPALAAWVPFSGETGPSCG